MLTLSHLKKSNCHSIICCFGVIGWATRVHPACKRPAASTQQLFSCTWIDLCCIYRSGKSHTCSNCGGGGGADDGMVIIIYSPGDSSSLQLHVLVGDLTPQTFPSPGEPHLTQCVIGPHMCTCQMAYESMEGFKQGV